MPLCRAVSWSSAVAPNDRSSSGAGAGRGVLSRMAALLVLLEPLACSTHRRDSSCDSHSYTKGAAWLAWLALGLQVA